MKTIWTIIGVIVLIAIIVVFYRMATNKKSMVMQTTPVILPNNNTSANKIETITEKQTIIVPVVVRNPADCNQAYQDNVLALYDIYLQKKVIYQNGIQTSDPNTIQYHKEMNTAYNNYYNEASKCRFFVR